jgi:hypothetical protein
MSSDDVRTGKSKTLNPPPIFASATFVTSEQKVTMGQSAVWPKSPAGRRTEWRRDGNQ